MSKARQTKRREVKKVKKLTPTVKDVQDLGEGFAKALVLLYAKVDPEKQERVAKALNEIKTVLDELPPGELVIATVNHVHDEVINRAQQIARDAAAKREGAVGEENLK